MNKTLLLFALLLLSLTSFAQELSRKKEVGLTFSSLNNFGITYRIGKENSLWRFNVLALSGNNQNGTADSIETKFVNNNFNFRIGKEFRKSIAGNLVFRFGLDLSFYYSKMENNRNDISTANYDYLTKTTTYGPGLNLVIGLNYTISKSFSIGAELLPALQYTMGTRTDKDPFSEVKSDIKGYNYGLSNTSAILSIVYQF